MTIAIDVTEHGRFGQSAITNQSTEKPEADPSFWRDKANNRGTEGRNKPKRNWMTLDN